jgi:hypothetical protein
MSNNIYDILKKMHNLEAPKQNLTESKKAKPDYIDIDKDGDKKEPMKKAAKEKSKGAVAEAVATVERQLSEKYMGFKKTVAAAGKKLGEQGVSEGRYIASTGQSHKDLESFMSGDDRHEKQPRTYDQLQPDRELDPKDTKTWRGPKKHIQHRQKTGGIRGPRGSLPEGEVDESALQAHIGMEKYGEEGMKALQQAGREGASDEKMARIRAQHDKMDEGSYNEDMLSPKQQKIARMAGDPKKIDANDLKALRAGKKKNAEGNAFSGALDAARDAGHSEFEVDGKTYKVKEGRSRMREGWEEMQKYLDNKKGPESKGGAGKKAGTRYGGSAQRDDDEETDGEGQAVVKKKGRPKGTGGGAKFSFKKPKD